MRVATCALALLSGSAEAFAPGPARVPGTFVAPRAASAAAQFGTGNFDRKKAKEVAKQKAKRADPSAKPELGALGVLGVSALGIPLVLLTSLYLAGPGQKTPFTFTDSISPLAVAESKAGAAKRAAFEEVRAVELAKEAAAKKTAEAKAAFESAKANKELKEIEAREKARGFACLARAKKRHHACPERMRGFVHPRHGPSWSFGHWRACWL